MGTCCSKDPLPQRHAETDSPGDGNEPIGQNESTMRRELVSLQDVSQPRLDFDLRGLLAIRLLRLQPIPASRASLRETHRGVRASKKALGIESIVWIERDPD